MSETERHGHKRFYKIMEELMDLHSRKNKDYATKENPLGNFVRVGYLAETYGLITPGNAAVKVALIYMLKQLDAVLKLVGRDQKGEVESVGHRLNDIAVYSVITRVIYEGGAEE